MMELTSSTYQRKWKFPKPLEASNHIKRYECFEIKSQYCFLALAILTSQTILVINGNPILNKDQLMSNKTVDLNADCDTSSSNDPKPTRLDANENELVQIDDSSSPASTGPTSLSPSPSQQHNSEQMISPEIDRQIHPTIENTDTFQANDLVNLLDLQQQHHQQQQQHFNDVSFAELNPNVRRRARSINEAFAGNEMLEAESDSPEFGLGSNPEFEASDTEDNSQINDSMSPLSLSSNIDVDSSEKEREAIANSQADLVNRIAMEDQQRKQNEMQTAQAQHVARAIEDQQAALTKQHEILMKQQLDEALNDSDNDREWRRTLSDSSAANPTVGIEVGESSHLSNSLGAHSDEDFDEDSDSGNHTGPADASNLNENYDLAPAAQHHSYGSHYGALHKHQGKYYQSVESHKKGQYKSAFKRGNKKFTISGHASQHKGHASGHVKWHSKKGKGSHHWDLKHKDKKHHKHHY